MLFGVFQERLELVFLGGERGFLGLPGVVDLLLKRSQGSLSFSFSASKAVVLAGNSSSRRSLACWISFSMRLNFFLAAGQLALGDFLAVLELPVQFLFGFLQLEAFFRKLFGQAVQFSLAFGFLRQEIGLERRDFGVPIGRLLGPFLLDGLQRGAQNLFFLVASAFQGLQGAIEAGKGLLVFLLRGGQVLLKPGDDALPVPSTVGEEAPPPFLIPAESGG